MGNIDMRILVTGGLGFIGTNYVEFLLRDVKAEFINLDSKSPHNIDHKKFWNDCDILDASRLEEIIKDFKPTHVVHLAAKTRVDEKQLSKLAVTFLKLWDVKSSL